MKMLIKNIQMNHLRALNKKLIIISAPSGAGKTTLSKKILKLFPHINYSISYTTRKPRESEQNGVDYFFIDTVSFEKKIKEKEWAEWAIVHQNYYGTSKTVLDKTLKKNKTILLDIDVKGAKQIFKKYPNCTSIFIEIPSIDVLKKRLTTRNTEDTKTIKKRLENAKEEIKHRHLYKHKIMNDKLKDAISEISNIVKNL